MNYFANAKKVFELDEGSRAHVYQDSVGYWTIGIGHLIGKDLQNLRFSPRIIEEQFKEDLMIATYDALEIVGDDFFQSLGLPRQLALISMLFTLGKDRFLKFKETIDAMHRKDWEEVADRILKTKWARDVDPRQRPNEGRDDRIAFMFRTGKFHPDYKIEESV